MKKSLGAKTIAYPTPIFVIASYDAAGAPNMRTAAWGGICCSEPPCIAVSVREMRRTYENILNTEAFTVNIPDAGHVKEADYVGIYSGHDEDKFESTGLTPLKSDLVNAPLVKEFPLALECTLVKTLDLGVHIQLIGEIQDVKADENILKDEGVIDVDKLRPFIFAPDHGGYYAVGQYLGKAFDVGRKE
jgi:flavin reductase (DIM6/NTAB) family NADH-FMN oxidoreductase RutF